MKTKTLDVWVDVENYRGLYWVNRRGIVRSLRRNPLSQKLTNKGYYEACLCKENKKKSVLVHKMVARAFIGVRPLGYDINHKNGVRNDNRVENLEYLTRSENIKDGYTRNKHYRRVFKNKELKYIKKCLGRKRAVDIARHLGVKPYMIYNIKYGRTYNDFFGSENE